MTKFVAGFIAGLISVSVCALAASESPTIMRNAFGVPTEVHAVASGVTLDGQPQRLLVDVQGRVICAPP